MNRERAKELLPIIQAFAEGRELQFRRTPRNIWENGAALIPDYDFHDDYEYRVKPKELWVMVYNNKTPSPCFSSSYKTEKAATDYMQTLQKDNPIMFDDAYVIKVREVCDDC